MSQEFRDLMRSFFGDQVAGRRRASWCPSVDIYRGQQQWLVKFDLAGVQREDLRIELDQRQLTVRGARRDTTLSAGHVSHLMEIAYNTFERTIELPFVVESADIRTEYRDGMLLLYITPQGGTS